ncbi:YbaB/EbfC family nucleoid-associated protein [Psychrobacillus glaciei]|uniref:Nucleoid-associated protein PB01_00125 n=1 Tax=Psychrobacillus glaciei TaxID=2283160 RepID=A0A5J6SKV8_9BACI|nr:YbaB/EbfC family nucleoid-associated protein [Psychrobacillus glaciei]QFF97364.1 YbaB/EbfC family nucleoid-associated protein [Psychrobacillus glaciei]
MRGMGNMQGMMKQMQKMQKKMAEAQEELGTQRFEAVAGGGMVKVVVSGHKEVLEVVLDSTVVDPEDVEMLQDLIVIATNEAMKNAEETANSTMGQFTKGLNLPGMF